VTINSIFLKLNVSYVEDVTKRVMGALVFLAENDVSRVYAA
jgi:hypothetical protein